MYVEKFHAHPQKNPWNVACEYLRLALLAINYLQRRYSGADIYFEKDIKMNLLDDGDIASRLSVSRSWVRKQRFLRNHNQDHILKIDPIYIGSMPRYRESDVTNWLSSI